MTEESMPLAELLAKSGGEDFLRSAAEAVLQLLMEADVEGRIGAARHERSGERPGASIPTRCIWEWPQNDGALAILRSQHACDYRHRHRAQGGLSRIAHVVGPYM